jgi:hypothetical protein
MFKIQNISRGNIPVELEDGGCVTLKPGQYLDLDVYCSRKWISKAQSVKHFINRGHMRLVHDSQAVAVKSAPTGNATQSSPKPLTAQSIPKEKPIIVDLTPAPKPALKPAPAPVVIPVEEKKPEVKEEAVTPDEAFEPVAATSEYRRKNVAEFDKENKPKRQWGRKKKNSDDVA